MEQRNIQPDNTAVRTALWRAMHLLADAPPHVIEDNVGLQLIAPDEGWQKRPDMDPSFTRRLRASIVARARFIEDLIIAEQERGITQYVILGAGLDTFAQRRPDIAARLQVYEIDQPDTQTWKQQRLNESGYGIPEWLHFVSVNFETSSWWDALLASGFDVNRPAVVVCTGVTLYLTREAITSTLKQLSALAPGSKLAITFYLPLELMDQEDQFLQQIAIKGAREAGTPFISFFSPDEIIALGKETGLKNLETVSTRDLQTVYFSGREDQLAPASGEIFLLATT
ncbi:methyltransferase, TIGR00027 family [Chitinophaga terrae (ex Kim and Jung 2007)]|uniref:S-adenosyl-L-methionine-dependent methyltransferase n=1 Tax=Chitinophaga terrae (ex Kim and Jung 2007) TaxID=408074 RepID=A0A1H3WSP9_9BACT|nr:class I SAM-dependent methyltransferase [Chitinophaga terrae (ex Kim and Jung 2007)]GEP90779.1 S-adenosyl-L-methionine-dependent methyltransferase [Chitinophaga terrae (ex Kim and Jung 2007)]SDZ89402.1 methyltransferase, TIGR00027 family [Chitinophaga terrae (ex Kim and Jung 2007)]